MFRTIYFRKKLFELIKNYSEINNITINKSVNDIIEEFLLWNEKTQEMKK